MKKDLMRVAIKHVSGRAYYTDDIPEPPETLYGAIGWSKKAHALIKKINLDKVIKSDGSRRLLLLQTILLEEMMLELCMMEIRYFQKKLNIMANRSLQ